MAYKAKYGFSASTTGFMVRVGREMVFQKTIYAVQDMLLGPFLDSAGVVGISTLYASA